jgi:hypothetical protein
MNPFMLPHSSSLCPHELWLMLDLDGDGWNGHERRDGNSAWKSYDRSL